MTYLQIKDNARTILDGQLLSGETTSFDVVDGSVFPTTNFVVTIEDEKILISSRTTNTLTISERGYDSTTPATHADATYVNLNLLAEHLEEMRTEIDNKADSANAMGSINHGADATTARPTGYYSITWIGTVEPTNATNDDIWIDVS